MRSLKLLTIGAGAIAGALLLAGCGGSSGGGGGTGKASFSVTDAPVDDVTNVFITFDRIDIKPEDGEIRSFALDAPRRIDLLTLQGANAEPLIEDIELAAGRYEFVRLFVIGGIPDSQVNEQGGGEFGLFVPGDQPQSQNPNRRFVQLASPFVITAGGDADFTIDVELRKALVKQERPAQEDFYLLRPALRLVDNSEVGTITGTVDDQLVNPGDGSCANDPMAGQGNAVYLYAQSDAAPGDVFVDENGDNASRTDGNDHPITAAAVTQNDSGVHEYTIGFVPAGDYTVAFTCDAVLDDPESEDSTVIEFAPQANVTVNEGQTTTQDFAASN